MKVFILLITFTTVTNAGLLNVLFGSGANNRASGRRPPNHYRPGPPPSIEIIGPGYLGHSNGIYSSRSPQTIKIIHEHLPSKGVSHSTHDTSYSNSYSGYGNIQPHVIKIVKEYSGNGGYHQNSGHNTEQVIRVIKDHGNSPENSIDGYSGAKQHTIKVIKEHGNIGTSYLPPSGIDTHSHAHAPEQVIHLIKEHGGHSHGYSSGNYNGNSVGHEQYYKIIKDHGSYPSQNYGRHSGNEQVYQIIKEHGSNSDYLPSNYPSHSAQSEKVIKIVKENGNQISNSYLPPSHEQHSSNGQEQLIQVINEHAIKSHSYDEHPDAPKQALQVVHHNDNSPTSSGYSNEQEQIFQVIKEQENSSHSDAQPLDHNSGQEKIIRLIHEGNQINSQAYSSGNLEEVKTLQVLQGNGQQTNNGYGYLPPATEWTPSNWTH